MDLLTGIVHTAVDLAVHDKGHELEDVVAYRLVMTGIGGNGLNTGNTGQAGILLLDNGTDGLVAFLGIRTALEDNGGACLQAKGRNLEGNIGTSLVDHANNAKRHADTTDVQSVLQHLVTEHTAQGGWQ